MSKEICDVNCIHEEGVTKSKKELERIDTLELSQVFKVLSDENRLKILYALSHTDKLCVCDISTIIEATTATTSHHLQSLKKIGLIDNQKIGKFVYYFIKDTRITTLINTGKLLGDVN